MTKYQYLKLNWHGKRHESTELPLKEAYNYSFFVRVNCLEGDNYHSLAGVRTNEPGKTGKLPRKRRSKNSKLLKEA